MFLSPRIVIHGFGVDAVGGHVAVGNLKKKKRCSRMPAGKNPCPNRDGRPLCHGSEEAHCIRGGGGGGGGA